MKPIIRSCLKGAGQSRGIVIVIDVFRASNTILMFFDKGVSSIFPVATVEDAFRMKKKHPTYLLAGERKGIKIDGFDMGNSPAEVAKRDLEGRHVIFTTSAGTQGITHAKSASRIFVGSFGNGRALTKKMLASHATEVVLLPIGTEGIRKAVEDELCAQYLKRSLEGKITKMAQFAEEIMKGEGARRLQKLGQEEDFQYCLATDIFDSVPEVMKTDDILQIRSSR